jgi:hypothetical protein
VSVKFQIIFPEDLASDLKATAAASGVSLAQFIRQTMEEKLLAAKARTRKDPFAWMDGLVSSNETDLASRGDEILYSDAGIS